MKLEMIQAHTRAYENPKRFRIREPVRTGERDQDNPEWIWCAASDTREGWVHESFLELHGADGTGTRDYTALELNAATGEKLEGIECASGWRLCRNAAGETGWVPVENLRALE